MTTYQDQPWSRRVMRDESDDRGDSLAPGGSGGEPLDYMTQQRPQQGDAEPFRARRDEPQGDEGQPPTQQIPAQDAPRFRIRDYSPEGRSTPSWAPTYTRTPDSYPGASGERLDYRTQQRPDGTAAASAESDGADRGSEAGALSPSGLPDPVITQTMTRRELRRLREEQEAAAAVGGVAAPVDEASAPEAPVEEASTPEAPVQEAPVEEAPVQEAPVEEPASWAPVRYFGSSEPEAEAAVSSSTAEPEAPSEHETVEPETAEPETAERETAEPADAGVRPDITAPGLPARESVWAAPPSSEPWRDAPPPAVDSATDALPESVADTAPGTPVESARTAETAPEPSAQPDDLDAWVASVFDPEHADTVIRPAAEEPPAAAGPPVALVEPPEPARWNPENGTEAAGAPSVLDSLFSPPAAAERVDAAEPATAEPISAEPTSEPEADAQSADEVTGEAPPASDPLSFLAGPSASDRVDLPAPPGAGDEPTTDDDQPEPADIAVEVVPDEVTAEQATDANTADVNATDATVSDGAADGPAPEIVVPAEAQTEAASDEVHPVVIDAVPLPAEPLPAELPTGHWTEQAAREDDAFITSRDVVGGHGVITTNALVLPSIPQPDLAGPLTGEIMVTGSIDLPLSLSSTGAHPTQLDQLDLDHELDPGDHQVVSTESQPVRAIRAVSTHTSTRGMMTSTKPRGNRHLSILIIVTGGLAVVVAGLLIVGLVTHAFG